MHRKSFFVSALAVAMAAALFSGSAVPATGGSSIAAMLAGPAHAGISAGEPTRGINGVRKADSITGTVSESTGVTSPGVA